MIIGLWPCDLCCVCSLYTQQAVPAPLPQRLLSVPEVGPTIHGAGASLRRRRRPQEGEMSACFSTVSTSALCISTGCKLWGKKTTMCVSLQAMAIMEVTHGKNHLYLTELRQEMSSGKLRKWATLDRKRNWRHFLFSLHRERSCVNWRDRKYIFLFYTSILDADLKSVADTTLL